MLAYKLFLALRSCDVPYVYSPHSTNVFTNILLCISNSSLRNYIEYNSSVILPLWIHIHVILQTHIRKKGAIYLQINNFNMSDWF